MKASQFGFGPKPVGHRRVTHDFAVAHDDHAFGELGDVQFRLVLQRALFQRLIGAEYVVRLAARGIGSTTSTSEAVS